MEKRITVGSKAFFGGMPDFQNKHEDILILSDTPNGFVNYRQSYVSERYKIEWAAKPKAEFLAYAMREKANGLEFGKFIVPDFAAEIGLTIDELKTLYGFYENRIDETHKYQKVIYQAYVDNNAFTLTEEQRSAAYEAYKEARTDAEVESQEQEDVC